MSSAAPAHVSLHIHATAAQTRPRSGLSRFRHAKIRMSSLTSTAVWHRAAERGVPAATSLHLTNAHDKAVRRVEIMNTHQMLAAGILQSLIVVDRDIRADRRRGSGVARSIFHYPRVILEPGFAAVHTAHDHSALVSHKRGELLRLARETRQSGVSVRASAKRDMTPPTARDSSGID